MIGYTQQQVLSARAIGIFVRTTQAVAGLAEHHKLRCHELARAVCIWLFQQSEHGVVVDGHFGIAEHSWLYLPEHKAILDPYAVGRLPMVQIISADAGIGTFVRDYKSDRTQRQDIDKQMVATLVVELAGVAMIAERRLIRYCVANPVCKATKAGMDIVNGDWQCQTCGAFEARA